MLKKILIGLVAVVLILVAVIATRPATYHVERSAQIAAPPAVVYDIIIDLKAWSKWSPWDELDPNVKKTFSEPASGKGAHYTWAGNSDIGAGKMAIVDVDAPNKVAMHLEFIEPFPSESEVHFTLAEAGEGTKVTWAMDGENNFISKAFSLFMSMDAMIGKDFEKGLGKLNTVAAAAAKERAEAEAKARAEAEAAAAEADEGADEGE